MGLDMYLGRYYRTKNNKSSFNVEETQNLTDLYSGNHLFSECPACLEDIAKEISITNVCYDMKKISKDFADGKDLKVCGFSVGKVLFRNYEENIELDLNEDMIEKDYTVQKAETVYIVDGNYEVAYWRKANQIRNWFVEHIDEFEYDDDGEYYGVTKDLLEELIADCKKVLSNHDLAEEILPTSGGFFFGSTEYDEYYFEQLKDTIEQCEKVIAETDWDNEVVVYHESW